MCVMGRPSGRPVYFLAVPPAAFPFKAAGPPLAVSVRLRSVARMCSQFLCFRKGVNRPSLSQSSQIGFVMPNTRGFHSFELG